MSGPSRVLVTGAAGLLGRHLLSTAPAGVEVIATWRRTPLSGSAHAFDQRVDLRDAGACRRLLEAAAPDLVIHTAYDPGSPDDGIVATTANVATAGAETGASLVHISTDVVFDGERAPYAEDDPLRPVTPYGAAKARAEESVVDRVPDAAIVRTSLLCTADPPDPRTAWILNSLDGGDPITLFTDEVRMPARVDDLARRIWSLAERPRAIRSGPWHLVGPEALSRHEIGLLVAAAGKRTAPLRAGLSADQAERRPRDLRLAVTRPETPLAPNRPIGTLFDRRARDG